MKKIILIIILFIGNLFPQRLSPIPTQDGIKFFYKPTKSINVEKVALAGTFNNWNKNENVFTFNDIDSIWTVTVKLNPNIEYHYKYVINDTLWITDPNAPDVTEDEWRNGIIIPSDYSLIYLSDFYPPRNKRITNLLPFYFFLSSTNTELLTNLNTKDILLKLDKKKQPIKYNKQNKKIVFSPDKNLSEGEHLIEIFIIIDNKEYLIHSGKFFLDRFKSKIITPEFYDRAILYEIFVRKFVDSNNDGIGDIRGLINHLDYLEKIGVNAIWLMPVNEGPTEHGYNITDYYEIEKDYGTKDDFFELIKECKKRKIKLIFDWVINHSDANHPFFLDAVNNPKSKYSKWYQFTDSLNSSWNHFGIEKNMPKFNFDNTEVWDYFIKNLLYWMDPNGDGNFDDGIDGVRCDAAKEVPHTFWNYLRKKVKAINKDFLLLAEVWDGANYLIPFFEDEFDMCFDYPFYYAMLDYFNNNNNKAIENILKKQIEIYPNNFQMVRFLSNHDNHRPLSLFDYDTLKFYQAMVMIFTLPGTPMIYYGDELGYTGKTPPENVRQKFDWSKINDTSNIIEKFYKNLINLRNSNSALSEKFSKQRKSVEFLDIKLDEVLLFKRKNKDAEFLICINNSTKEIKDLKFDKKTLNIKNYKIIFSKNNFLNLNYQNINENKINLLPRDFIILKKK